jgi:hypothetical protein
MPPLLSDLNLSICLNYADDAFINMRLQLTNKNITEPQAIIVLRNICQQSENTTANAQWQAQIKEDRERQEHSERMNEEEQERQEQD